MKRYALLGPYLTFRVLGKPEPQGAIRHFGKGRPSVHANQERLLPWREHVQAAAEKEIERVRADRMRDGIVFPIVDSPVCLATYFTVAKPTSKPKTRTSYPISRPDTSHLIRAVEDALTAAGVYRDDALIVETMGGKFYPNEERRALHVPGVLIQVFGVVTVEEAIAGEAIDAEEVA